MSGFGERFRAAGYTVPKPMIDVDGKPIIEYVVNMFSPDDDFIFICNREHLENPEYKMQETLERISPNGRIVAIAPHKLGPVHAVLQAEGYIDKQLPTIINYCDFTCYWNYNDFKNFVLEEKLDGAIPCYTGFHPHMLGNTNYAYPKLEKGLVVNIQEKKPWTDNPILEYASSGTYYFNSGATALHYCKKTIEKNYNLNGEFYASLVYKPMCEEGKKIKVYELEHFMQWGTPQDLAEYLYYSKIFRLLIKHKKPCKYKYYGANLMPMAGAGSRFAKQGYTQPKPLIPVMGRPMVMQAASDMPMSEKTIFILRSDLPQLSEIKKTLLSLRGGKADEAIHPNEPDTKSDGLPRSQKLARNDGNVEIVELKELTEGQAITALLGLEKIDPNKPLTIAACDNGMIYDEEKYHEIFSDPKVDVIVWVTRNHPNAVKTPNSYGWVEEQGGVVRSVSVKKPLSNPKNDPIIIGAFTFKKASYFKLSAERMIANNTRVNNEFYIDTCINDAVSLGLNVRIFEIDAYLCFGTPEEYKTFNYWQDCFDKWNMHPYKKS